MKVPALYPIVDLDFDFDHDDVDHRLGGHQTSVYDENDFEAKSDVYDVMIQNKLLGPDECMELSGYDPDFALFGRVADALRANELMAANLEVRCLVEEWPVVDFVPDEDEFEEDVFDYEDEFEEDFLDGDGSHDEIATDERSDPWERLCALLDEPDDEVVSSFGHTLH